MNALSVLEELSNGKAVLVGLFILMLYFGLGYDDGSSHIQKNTQIINGIEKNRLELIKLEEDLARAKELQKTVEILGPQFQELTALIPADLSSPDLMKIVSTEAKVAGLNISSLREASSPVTREREPRRRRGRKREVVEDPTDFYQVITIGVNLEGNFAQLMTFMSSLTRLGQIITFDRFSLDSRNAGVQGESPLIKYQGQISGYRYAADDNEDEGN